VHASDTSATAQHREAIRFIPFSLAGSGTPLA
jgi:hypothetical protein